MVNAASDSEHCPVCAGGDCSTLYPRVEDPITGDRFQVTTCSECGLAFTVPRPSNLDRYYPKEYRAYGPLVRAALSSFYGLRVKRWAALKGEAGSVLEIGCGPGLMLRNFQQRGWRVLGIERNEQVAEAARRTCGIEITTAPLEQLADNLRFDLIIMFHVLEHIADPVALLKECARHLEPAGHLIIAVPNLASWQANFAKEKWLHLDVPRHLNHFTPQTLEKTLARAGFRLERIQFASPEHDPYGWIESAISRATGRMNVLTRFLMRLDRLTLTTVLAFAAGALLTIPAGLLAIVSWPLGRGAVMEATAGLSSSGSSDTQQQT